jgi:hypothetical protein
MPARSCGGSFGAPFAEPPEEEDEDFLEAVEAALKIGAA